MKRVKGFAAKKIRKLAEAGITFPRAGKETGALMTSAAAVRTRTRTLAPELCAQHGSFSLA